MMGVFGDILRRDNGDARNEDFALIYHPDMKQAGYVDTELHSEVYRNHRYKIFSVDGMYPRIIINTHFPFSHMMCKDHDGEKRLLKPIHKTILSYEYNTEEDFVTGEHDGVKHSLSKMIQDAESFIDEIVDEEANLMKSAMNDKN